MHRLLALLVAALAVALPAGARSEESPAPMTALGLRGFVTDRATAEHAIAFRPFVPDRSPSEVAIIPPFHGGQLSKYEGIAYDYGRHGRSWILQQWPRNGGDLTAFATLPAQTGCTDVHAVGGRKHPRGVAWTTPRGLVFSLTPDGGADPRTILAEFRRLVKLGACR